MNVYLYVLDTLADWEIGYITAEINSGRYSSWIDKPVELIKVGKTLDPIQTMGGITIAPDIDVNQLVLKKYDVVILPGANTWLDERNEAIINMISGKLNDIVVAAICGATAALAAKGVLNNRRHTSNNLLFLKEFCPGYSGEENYSTESVVVDENLITANGCANLEFTFEIFKIMNFMEATTLEAWYQLHRTQEGKYFYALMESLNA